MDYVKQRMQLGVLNAERILREIREQGYTGGITVLREFMKPLRPVVSAKATERFESDPGEQAQIDVGFPLLHRPLAHLGHTVLGRELESGGRRSKAADR
ncbi:hypothetical protein [Alicyclobacillus fructus]|uniref:hypothetical protein n=1 Tax=Alicyclobacillus fructus TaxID=2816082 RepID=UPI001F2A33DB|nr:hypothetical protein [Alicyclobacillus fructus]